MASGLLIAILAAGSSQRLGRAKQLVGIHGEPLLRRQCRIALEARIGAVAAILGCEADRCAAALAGLPVAIRVNDQWTVGLASSIKAAVAVAAAEQASGLLLLHGDQYRVTSQDLKSIGAVWMANPALACRARHEDYAGPPVILPAASFDDASKLTGDQGARQLLARLGAGQLTDVEMPSALYDLDLPAQLPEFNDSPSDVG